MVLLLQACRLKCLSVSFGSRLPSQLLRLLLEMTPSLHHRMLFVSSPGCVWPENCVVCLRVLCPDAAAVARLASVRALHPVLQQVCWRGR